METAKKIGRCSISFECLEGFIPMPEDSHIVGAVVGQRPGCIEILIEGPNMPEVGGPNTIGSPIAEIELMLERVDGCPKCTGFAELY